MDLLDGYGSDGDGSSSSSQNSTKWTNLPSAEKEPVPRPKTNAPVISKRGKKLVSLHAVLPPHILEQLTNGTNDTDDEEEVVSRETIPKNSISTSKRGKSDGISSFLLELGSAKGSALSRKAVATEKMGLSFFQTTTTVLTKVSDKNQVVNVHNSQPPEPTVETVHGKDHDGDREITVEKDESTPMIRRNAAPKVHVPLLNATRPPVFQSTLQPASNPTTISSSTTSYPVDEEDEANFRLTKKRSRKEMEKLLRSGNMKAIDDHENVRSFDAEEHVYVPQISSQPKPSGTGVRVAPVAMYDTKAGKDVLVGSNMSGRGKNQINYLMASAAAFEANEIQQAKAKTQRASAKRKYGW